MREWLFNARENASMTQEQVAYIAGIDRTHYVKIEKGMRRPSYEVATKIASILDIDWTLFFENNENAS